MPIPLVERSEREIARSIKRRIGSLDGVAQSKGVTMGFTRKKPNIHLHVVLMGNPSFEDTHLICFRIDQEVRTLVPNSRVVIHSEPVGMGDTVDVWQLVKKIADNEPRSRGVQNIHLKRNNGDVGVDIKLQLDERSTKEQAVEIESKVAQTLKNSDPRISEAVIHQDSVRHLVFSEQWGHGTELTSYVEHLATRFPELAWVGPLTSKRAIDGIHFVDRVAFRPGTNSDAIARIKTTLGTALKKAYPAIVGAEIVEVQPPVGVT